MISNTTTLQRTYDLHYDEIVIGCNLSALLYSHIKKIPFIYLETQKPNTYEMVEDISPSEFFDKLYVELSFLGFNIFTNTLASIEVQGDKIIARTKGGDEFTIYCKSIKVFDTWNLLGVEFIKPEPKNIKFEVYDYYNLSLGKNTVSSIKDRNNFVKEVKLLYPDSNGYFTRVLSISYLNYDELYDPDYNETCSRIKTKRMMKKAGIVGRTSKQTRTLTKYDENNNKYKDVSYYTYVRPIYIKNMSRLSRRLNCHAIKSTEFVQFMNMTPQEVFTSFTTVRRARFTEVMRMMYGTARKFSRRDRNESVWRDRI